MPKVFSVYSDGGARGNPGPAAIGVLICDEKGIPVKEFSKTIGHTTNNAAEYTGVIAGLDLAAELEGTEILCFLDSELVCRQLKGEYRVKTPHILELYLRVREREKKFQRVVFTHVPRTHEKIRRVDKLVNRALDGEALSK